MLVYMYIVHTVDKPYKRHTFLVERTNFKVQPYIYLTLSPIRFFALILFCIKWMHLFNLTLLFSYLKQFYHASVIFATLFTLYNNLLWFAHILQQSTMPCPPFTTNLPCSVHLLQQSTMLCPPFTTIYHALPTFCNNLPCFAHLLQQSTTLCPPFATIYHALSVNKLLVHFVYKMACFLYQFQQMLCSHFVTFYKTFSPFSLQQSTMICSFL